MPGQIETFEGEIDALGDWFTETFLDADAVHPPAFDTVTEYCVVDIGLTVMLAVVSTVLHEKEVPPLAVRVMLPPTQIPAF